MQKDFSEEIIIVNEINGFKVAGPISLAIFDSKFWYDVNYVFAVTHFVTT